MTAGCRGRARTQFPPMHAWAMTVHKVQGLSLAKAVIIDLGCDTVTLGRRMWQSRHYSRWRVLCCLISSLKVGCA